MKWSAALTLASVAAVVLAAWYALRARALWTPPVSVAPVDGILASSTPAPSSSSSSSSPAPSSSEDGAVASWRAAVVRSAIGYRDALAAAAVAVPSIAAFVDAQRVATLMVEAATTETRPMMRFRVAFVRSPASTTDRAVVDAGPRAVELVGAMVRALDALRMAVDAEPRTIYELPPELAARPAPAGGRILRGGEPIGGMRLLR